MARRWGLVAASPAAVAGIALATLGAAAGSSAGQPRVQNAILCGTWVQTDSVDSQAGQSNQDKIHGGDVSGGQYYTPDSTHKNCHDEYNGSGGFNNGTQTFTWKVSHSNVNVSTEHGTEHGLFTLQNTSAWAAGFNGRISNYDFATSVPGFMTAKPDSGPGSGQTTFYVSNGNFNTHGGAASGAHFRGNYTVLIYQDSSSNSPCKPTSSPSMYCFQAILTGQVN